tara:strand:+ start:2674 stop:3039 length:366 start_codon:yes stop_codon:yes gene_type:complete
MNEDRAKTYILAASYLEDLLGECEEQISTSKDLICDFISNDACPKGDLHLLPVTEILFVNLTMACFINSEIEISSPTKNEETGEYEILVSEEAISLLQSMALSRYYANVNLNKISYSVSLH